MTFEYYRCSFSLSKVVRTVEMDDGSILVLLDDLHQRLQEIPIKNKAGKTTSVKHVLNAFQSEISLSKEDAQRFFEITSIGKYEKIEE
jgi:hypothetical protein